MSRILLVDDDLQALESTRRILEFAGYQVTTAPDGQKALEHVRPSFIRSHLYPSSHSGSSFSSSSSICHAKFDVVITDVRMPKLGGLEFLRALSLCGETMPVILMTAFGRVEDAVWAMKLGAVDFLTKPFKRQILLSSVEAALKRSRSRQIENQIVLNSPDQSASQSRDESDPLMGHSEAMLRLKDLIRRVAATHANVLLTGESGTGKELVARCLHLQSSRSNKKFIALNCAAVPEQLIESELFGFEKGAFTGATAAKEGLFEAANGGTLLLDEIGDMPFTLQAKLLRTLQENEVRRLGATLSKKIDVRVIAATHKNLRDLVQQGGFRQDLLYRLEIVGIHVPPLRERKEDIPDLIRHFIKTANRRHGKEIHGISPEALDILMEHSWPGNVRELSNVIERAVVFSTVTTIAPEDLPSHLSLNKEKTKNTSNSSKIEVPIGTSLKAVEELLIRKTLEATSGDKNMTAKLLGINSRTIYRKLDKKLD